MRKVLYLLGEPLDIQTLYEQSIYIVLRFKNGEARKDMTGFDADLAVWLNQGTNLIEGSTQSGAITFASTANDAILDEMRILIDFIGTNNVCPAPYSYKYRLNIENGNVDTFALNGKFVILDVAPDDFQIQNVQPSVVTFSQTSVTVSVEKMDVDSLGKLNDVSISTPLQEVSVFGYIAGKWRNLPRYMRVQKYTSEGQLPASGSLDVVYFLNVAGVKYLKYWNGTAYVNASTKTDLPKCISGIQRDYYATFADISTDNYAGRAAEICVIEDSNNTNGTGLYYFDGTTLNELLLL